LWEVIILADKEIEDKIKDLKERFDDLRDLL